MAKCCCTGGNFFRLGKCCGGGEGFSSATYKELVVEPNPGVSIWGVVTVGGATGVTTCGNKLS